MVCPVCGKKSQYLQCPQCGFDSSRDYEKYPTLTPVKKAPSVSARRKKWQETGTETGWIRRFLPVMIACAALLILCIGMGEVFGGGQPAETEPAESPAATVQERELWKENILRYDEIPAHYVIHTTISYVVDYPVFGSEYLRRQIISVTFLDTLADAPEDAWDVSEAGDGRVMAWVLPDGELYGLYIGAEGGIRATEACKELFAGYSNLRQIQNMEFLHTEGAQDMSGMFLWCLSLTGLDLRGFDTSQVRDMRDMFYCCEALTDLDLGSFDTAKVKNMNGMFSCCESLTSLDLSGFDTAGVEDMGRMFCFCESLTDLTLGAGFVTQYADTARMFDSCPAGEGWQHLLK